MSRKTSAILKFQQIFLKGQEIEDKIIEYWPIEYTVSQGRGRSKRDWWALYLTYLDSIDESFMITIRQSIEAGMQAYEK